MTGVYVAKDAPYNLRYNNSLVLPRSKTSLYGVIIQIRFIGKKLWQTLQIEFKESQSLEIFKRKIKSV